MFRKLLILGAIAALFTIMTAAPAFGIAVNTGQGSVTVLDNGPDEAASPAHGPLCGFEGGPLTCTGGVSHDNPGAPGAGALTHPQSGLGVNAGAWNSVFGPGGIGNENSAICGITVDEPPDDDPDFPNTCDDPKFP